MEKVLKLYKYINGTTSEAFPSEKEQVIVSSFRYDAKRMGGAPTISCSVMHSSCLDNLWTDNVYASFNGEKYFIKQVPTSSYGNSDTRYKYDIELVSERILLDNVYFYDVVSSSSSDRPVSHSSDFSFFGTISEFASRLNQSLRYSKLDYSVVVDSGISSEPKLISFQDQFFSNVLQEIFNTYQLPYYFDGKTIHIGYTNNAITKTFKYGQSESLLSIQKQNANYKIVNRVTGVGSPDNIPYYYPNDYESKSEVEANGGTWINPQHNLMPSIYRDSYGSERFYSAKNNTYISPQTGDYYVFDNPYTGNNPKEHIVNFENIKPTIEGIKNGSGYRIDMFREFAYDLDDNDETDEEGNYKHPYFFAKLRQMDGEFGFNLFDHAIDEEEMVISMTSGSCGACEFIIGVDENTNKNIVQVDENGNLLRDENGNVKFGAPQDRQNDTVNNEVWIALKKDIDTFGVIMPNASSNYKPSVNDTFVILHIDLPKSYIIAAEKRLDDELIKYMAMNNDEKFNFSIEFSRIFFAENPSILDQLNENARIQIEYDDNRYELYVSSFSYAMNDNAQLPEVRVELSDTLTISQNALQNAIDEVKQDIMSSVGSVDFLKQGLRYFLRKDVDDRSRGVVASDKGLEVGNFIEGMIGGQGAKVFIDKNGKTIIEVDKIHGREELIVPQITYNTIEVVAGEMAQTFAYGTIKSVSKDDDGEFVVLDLLKDEYGTPDTYDFLRGVFHFMDKDNNAEEGLDHNNFHKYVGFTTSYFTPYFTSKDLSLNGKGYMQFHYKLQSGTTIHPCPAMKFYAYGNSMIPSRRSITYHTREYTRRIEGVATWNILDSYIVQQTGNLDGLTIGGKDMSGYSSFQKNLYLTGSVIEFTEQQKEDLKGEGAYQAILSSYVGIIRINDKGEIVEERHNEQGYEYYLRVVVQARKGEQELVYSDTLKEGVFLVSIRPVGCVASIINGTIFVTEILEDVEHAYVEISVSCEGNQNFELLYDIKLTKDGIGGFDSLAFTRTNSTPNTPSGGSYESPVPEDVDENGKLIWSDGIPSGTEQIWMSKCHFVSNGKYPDDAKWTTPKAISDTSDFEVVYHDPLEDVNVQPAPPTNQSEIAPNWTPNNGWTDEPTDNSMWMATIICKNGVWGEWQVVRIKGETGDSPLRMVSSYSSVTRNSFGSYEPRHLYIKSVRGDYPENVYMILFGRDKDDVLRKYTYGTGSSWTIDMASYESIEWKTMEFRGYLIQPPASGDFNVDYEMVPDSEVGINFVTNGEGGPMARNCGRHNINNTYIYDNEYRDYVWTITPSGSQVYIRTNKGVNLGNGEGEKPNIDVTNTEYWLPAPKTSLTAIDTALIDNANIAGFTFTYKGDDDEGRPTGVLASQNEKIILDAKNGKLTCIDGYIDGDLTVGSIRFKTRETSGVLDGYSLGLGGYLFELPWLQDGQNMELKVLFPHVESRVNAGVLSVYVTDPKASIVVPDTTNVWAKFDTTVGLHANILYNIFGYCDNDGYTVWYIGGSYGSTADTPINVKVDNVVIQGSQNAVSGGAVFDALSSKIQEISTDSEATSPNVLYVITNNQG